MREHLVISQFPSGSPVRPTNFVLRDRTMALLSHATIIVEAKDDSGSLHTGWEVLRLSRALFIWKGVLADRSLKVPRKMLDYGALELSDSEQVTSFLPSSSSEPVVQIRR